MFANVVWKIAYHVWSDWEIIFGREIISDLAQLIIFGQEMITFDPAWEIISVNGSRRPTFRGWAESLHRYSRGVESGSPHRILPVLPVLSVLLVSNG